MCLKVLPTNKCTTCKRSVYVYSYQDFIYVTRIEYILPYYILHTFNSTRTNAKPVSFTSVFSQEVCFIHPCNTQKFESVSEKELPTKATQTKLNSIPRSLLHTYI